MNTNFNIFWFEDNDEWYEVTKNTLGEYLENLNFKPCFVRLKSADSVQIELHKDTNFDLILADLNLLDKTMGNTAILEIRKLHILADVLFYSNNGISGLKNAMKSEVLEGVYLSVRDEPLFQQKLEMLVNKIVKRSEDIINIRGMLMDNVSEFDVKLKEAVQKYLSIVDDQEKIDTLNKYAFDVVVKQVEGNKDKSEKLLKSEKGFILTALEDEYLIDSNKLSRIVNKIFNTEYTKITCMKNFYNDYVNEILKERNNLAHAKKELESEGAFYFEDKIGNKITYDSTKCSEIRANINKYNKLISEIIDFIN